MGIRKNVTTFKTKVVNIENNKVEINPANTHLNIIGKTPIYDPSLLK